MITKIKCKRICCYIQLAGLILCFFFAGCASTSMSPAALHYDVSCSPLEAHNQLRQYFSTQRIRTSEAAPDNKSFAITTDLIKEPRSGRVDRQLSYKLEVKPTENANTAIINLSRVAIKSKGVRERDWHDEDEIGEDPQSEQQLSKEIQSICRAGQQ